MFLLQIKTLMIEAVKTTFDSEHPVPDMRDIWVSMEYPVEAAHMPGIWVDFTPTADLQSAGIGHTEDVDNGDGTFTRGTRWRFGGHVSFTISAMSSRERDRIADEVVRMIAFGGEYPALSQFRRTLEVNDLIQVSMQWDTVALSGKDEAPGTPWGSDEMVYEITVGMDCQGSFVSGSLDAPALVPLSKVVIQQAPVGEEIPPFATSPDTGTPAPNPWQ